MPSSNEVSDEIIALALKINIAECLMLKKAVKHGLRDSPSTKTRRERARRLVKLGLLKNFTSKPTPSPWVEYHISADPTELSQPVADLRWQLRLAEEATNA